MINDIISLIGFFASPRPFNKRQKTLLLIPEGAWNLFVVIHPLNEAITHHSHNLCIQRSQYSFV